MSNENVVETLRVAILEGDDTQAAGIAREISGDADTLSKAVEAATETIRLVGDRFGTGECYLPEMILAAEAMLAFMQVAGPHLEAAGRRGVVSGKVVLGTVKGDIHTIGKDIVATMLTASGFEVVDMGVDVAPMELIKTAESSRAQIIGLSALMTTSMPYQKEVVDLLTELKMRDAFWVIVGGGPVTPEYARGIGANGWAPNAAAAARLCGRLLNSGQKPSTAEFLYEEK